MCSTDMPDPDGAPRAIPAAELPPAGVPTPARQPAEQPTGPSAGQLGSAIEDLAAAAQSGTTDADDERLTDMLAAVWGLVAELDPDLARRLDAYRS
jgi:hypothetical protein